ncbi:unnamed protein product [Medioppia subpectinata]|uniref:C2H2-type domain-containing protein n=1 Tax=Medioppia subpectinata TaxID=1979941 RepID=A0A7R9Q1L0_9ACAR|nr:unnamed protein product [Medioppia subpectinata]CAG2109335.1 unnamed protein product [Medioppia subpectinata]
MVENKRLNNELLFTNNDNDLEVVVTNEDSDEEWRPSTSAADKRLKRKLFRPPVGETQAIYECDFEGCTKSYSLARSLTRHRLDHMNAPTDGSIDPIYETEQYKRLKKLRHLSRKTSETFRCDREGCEYQTNVWDSLKRHRMSHNNPASEAQRERRRELKSRCYDSTTNTYICDHTGCQKVYKLFERLRQHVIRTHKVENVVCDYADCGKVCKNKTSLNRHYIGMHCERQFPCPHPNCGRLLPNASDLKKHQVMHQTDRPFACDFNGCHKTFKDKYRLKRHQLIHSTEPTYKRVYNKRNTSEIEDNSNEVDNDFGEEMAANEDSDEERRPSTSAVDKQLKGKPLRPPADETQAVYQCDLEDCDYCTHLWPNLVAHRKTHDNPKSEDNEPNIGCDYDDCPKLFRTHDIMRRHYRRSHRNSKSVEPSTSDTAYECPHEDCDRRYRNRQQLDRHLVAHQTAHPFACNFEGCLKSYRSAVGLRKHRLNHLSAPTDGSIDPITETEQYKRLKKLGQLSRKTSETFRCDREGCEYQTNVYQYLWAHRRTHYNAATEAQREMRWELKRRCYDSTTNTYICDHTGCERVYKLFDRLKRHLIHSHTVEKVVCDYADCGKVCKNKHSLNRHYISMHSDRQFACPHPNCGHILRNASDLKNHQVMHQTDRPFACDFNGCHKTFKDKYRLKSHQLIHSTEPTVKCTVDGCTQLFLTQYFMIRHRIAVHNFKPYDTKKHTFTCQWPGCEYTTQIKHRMDLHKNMHTGERPYVCEWPECGKGFNDPSGLRTHMNIHQNVQPFACHWPGCTYRSSDHSSRYKHMKSVHKK